LVQADGDGLERACLSGLVTGGCDDIGKVLKATTGSSWSPDLRQQLLKRDVILFKEISCQINFITVLSAQPGHWFHSLFAPKWGHSPETLPAEAAWGN
jgi:hypothetical protein